MQCRLNLAQAPLKSPFHRSVKGEKYDKGFLPVVSVSSCALGGDIAMQWQLISAQAPLKSPFHSSVKVEKDDRSGFLTRPPRKRL